MRWFIVFLMMLASAQSIFAGDDPLFFSDYAADTHTVKDLFTIDPRFEPTEIEDQTGQTCFAHAARNLLQYHHNATAASPSQLPKVESILSQIDKQGSLKDGGISFQVLHHAKGKELIGESEGSPTVTISPYNVHVFDPRSSALADRFEGDTPVAILIQAVKNHFTPPSPGVTVSPMTIRYKDEVGHAVALFGVRTVCKNTSPDDCIDEWKIKNSWGEGWDDWFEAMPLAESILEGRSEISYITPCGSGFDEACSPYILGLSFPGQKIEESQKFLASFPLNNLVIAHDDDNFFNLLKDDQMRERISERSGTGDTLPILAAIDGSLEILRWVAINYPGLLIETGSSRWNVAHFAAMYGFKDGLIYLLDYFPHPAISGTKISPFK